MIRRIDWHRVDGRTRRVVVTEDVEVSAEQMLMQDARSVYCWSVQSTTRAYEV